MILAMTIGLSGSFWQAGIPELFERRVAIEQKVLLGEGVAGQSHFRGSRTGGTPVHLVRRRAPDKVAVAHREIVTRHVRCSVSRESDQ